MFIFKVTPFVGVWIETFASDGTIQPSVVTPFVGVWIETIGKAENEYEQGLSHPSWVCGLKHSLRAALVARSSHTLRGCVD